MNKYIQMTDVRKHALGDKPWRERVHTYNRIKHQYLDRGLPAEQFLSDYPDLVEKYNITNADLDYVVSLIKKQEGLSI